MSQRLTSADCVQTACPFVHTDRSKVDESIPHKHFKAILAAIRTEISMSAGPATSPIQRLDFDVLWHIFNINADIFDNNRALETTLATSYVCHDWRTLSLSSSSLWAHSIGLHHWMWYTVEGSKELIRRSGTTLLWINTQVPMMHSYLRKEKQIPDILDTHWDRVQKLEVTVHCAFMNQSPLCRPALHLESLRVQVDCYHGKPELHHLSSSLFSGSAPMIHDLRWKGYGLNITASSWLRQVRYMDISAKLTVFELLQVLESTIDLMNLRLDRLVADNRAQLTLPFVSLPQLAHLNLNLSDKLTPGAVLLEHLHIPPYCAVIFSARQIQEGEIDKKNTFGSIAAAISACAQRCLAHHLPQRLQVVMTHASFRLEATDYSLKPYFSFHIDIAPQKYNRFPGNAHFTLLHEFTKLGLSKVTVLELGISRNALHVPGLERLIERLPSVETIVTGKPFLLDLCRHLPVGWINPPPSASNFPMLKTLRLRSFTFSQLCFKSHKDRDPVSRYIMGRIACGYAYQQCHRLDRDDI